MPIVFIVLTRILFITSMVFIFGYVFGNFSKNKTLSTITKVSSVLALVLFLSGSIFLFRFGGWRHDNRNHDYGCYHEPKDSVIVK